MHKLNYSNVHLFIKDVLCKNLIKITPDFGYYLEPGEYKLCTDSIDEYFTKKIDLIEKYFKDFTNSDDTETLEIFNNKEKDFLRRFHYISFNIQINQEMKSTEEYNRQKNILDKLEEDIKNKNSKNIKNFFEFIDHLIINSPDLKEILLSESGQSLSWVSFIEILQTTYIFNEYFILDYRNYDVVELGNICNKEIEEVPNGILFHPWYLYKINGIKKEKFEELKNSKDYNKKIAFVYWYHWIYHKKMYLIPIDFYHPVFEKKNITFRITKKKQWINYSPPVNCLVISLCFNTEADASDDYTPPDSEPPPLF